jgi:hypothetical protein
MWAKNNHFREGRCSIPCLTVFERVFEAAQVENEWESFKGETILGSNGWTNRTLENSYPGAYAYHIHNRVGFPRC